MYLNLVLIYMVIGVSVVYKHIESAKLAITPSHNFQVGSSPLTIRCSATSGIIKLYSMDITRSVYYNTCTGAEHMVGSIDAGSNVTLGSGFTQTKYTAIGSLPSTTQVSGSYLQIVINVPDYTDQAEYTCITLAGSTQGPINPTPEDRGNITVQKPGFDHANYTCPTLAVNAQGPINPDPADSRDVTEHIGMVIKSSVTVFPASGEKHGDGIGIGYFIVGMVTTIVTTVLFCFVHAQLKKNRSLSPTCQYNAMENPEPATNQDLEQLKTDDI